MKNWRHRFFEFRAECWAKWTYLTWRIKSPGQQMGSRELKSIVHINSDDQSGGAARVARDLCEAQLQSGYRSKMLVGNKRLESNFSELIPAIHSKKQHFLSYAQHRLNWQDFFHLSSFGLVKNQTIQRADILHLHNLHGNYFSYLALPELSHTKHVVWSIHDMHPFTGHCSYSMSCSKWQEGCGSCPSLEIYPSLNADTTAFIHRTKKRSFQKSEIHIVALSKWMEQQLRQSILKHHPIHVIYNGIDTEIYTPQSKKAARNLLGLPEDKIILLFSANLGANNPFKGAHYLDRLIEDHEDQSAYLFIAVGGNEEMITKENRMDIPYISDARRMATYYAAADVYLYPSLADNCPLVVLESMACGTPVLAFDTGGTAELVLHKQTGYVARYKEYDDLKEGLNWILKDVERYVQLSDLSTSRIQSHFTLERMNEQYLSLYNQLIQKNV